MSLPSDTREHAFKKLAQQYTKAGPKLALESHRAAHALAQTTLDAHTGICKGGSQEKGVSDVHLL